MIDARFELATLSVWATRDNQLHQPTDCLFNNEKNIVLSLWVEVLDGCRNLSLLR